METQISKITSRENQRLKNAVKVRDGRDKSLIFVEGARVCEELLRFRLIITACYFDAEFAETERGGKLLEQISAANAPLFEVAAEIFKSISDTVNSQGIIVIAEKPKNGKIQITAALKLKNSNLVVLLDEVNNPSNLGAILRSAEAAGVAGVIVSKNSADVYSQKSIRAAMGANFRLPIWTNADFDEALEWAAEHGLTTTAADINSAEKYTEIDWKIPRLLIFGSEAHGLPENKAEIITDKIYIPMENEVESLNLAVSCGIILFEAKNRR